MLTKRFLHEMITCLSFLLLAVTAGGQKTFAQSSNDFTTFELTQSTQNFNISGSVYVTEDKDGKLLWSEVLRRHVNNIRGEKQRAESINLSFSPNPHYLVFSLHNKTQNNQWVLNLGQRSTGRTGLIDSFYFYNASKKQMIADTVSPDADILSVQNTLIGPAIPFRLNPGDTALFLLYIQSDNGLPFTLPLRVSSQAKLSQSLLKSNATHNIVLIFCVVGIGFYFGVFLLRQRWEYLLFGSYFLVLFNIYDSLNTRFFQLEAYDNLSLAILLNVGAFVALCMNATFLNFKKNRDKTSLSVTYLLGVLSLLCIPILSFLTPVGHVSRPLFFIGIPFTIVLFVAYSAFLKSFRGRPGALFLSIGWLSFGLGIATSHLSYLNIVDPSQLTHIGTWISMVPQCLFFIAASAVKFRSLETKSQETRLQKSSETDSLVRIQRSKEAADQQRLLRVIEREREVMEELREREAQRTDEMRIAKEAADEANRAKSAFLAIVSHEIRTPMTGILGMVKLLMKTQLTKDQSNYAITIQESGETMLALLNDILDFEKIESGKMDIEIVDFDLKRLVNSVVTLMSGHAREKGIDLKPEIVSHIPNFVSGDPTRIRQVLLNLVGNAIKFTDKGGVTLVVRAHEVKIDDPSQTQTPKIFDIYFGVKDTGIGISEEAQKNLFNPFAQADSSISRKFGGTGLGLAICKALITAMGSQINLNSREGEGSTFSFVLKLPAAASDQVSEDSSKPILSATEDQPVYRILLCEDNEINQKVVVGFLEPYKHQIDIANDGIEAVTKATGDVIYDLILMDIEMPGQNGLEASTQIREIGGLNAQTPIVALSGNVSESDKQKCYNNGMNDHLAKPVNPDALENMIGKIETHDFAHKEIVIAEDTQQASDESSQAILAQQQPYEKASEVTEKETPEESPEEALEQAHSHQDSFEPDALDLEEDSFSASIDRDISAEDDENNLIFDKTMLQTLKDSLPADQINELLDSLFEKSDELSQTLSKAAKDNDLKEIVARAHELKGMAGNFGLTRLSAKSSTIEKKARDQEDVDYIALVTQLSEEIEIAKKAIKEW